MKRFVRALTGTVAVCTTLSLSAKQAEPGLLFHLSGDHGTTADFSAAGNPEPTFVDDVTAIADGASGPALRCGGFQRLAWRAPGHIYAQRGTVSFFWRAHTPLGPTAFPLFRVSFADHSSWDMVFLRIDYNGHGLDAFVTDTGLARVRVSSTLSPLPAPDDWIHIAFSWDENTGVRLYLDGRLLAAKDQVADLDAGLDQFGPHSRLISPHNVQSDYNFIRGGDIDEIRVHDRMLDEKTIAGLAGARCTVAATAESADSQPVAHAAGQQNLPAFPKSAAAPEPAPSATPNIAATEAGATSEPDRLAAWKRRYGWADATSLPPPLPARNTIIRKVEIHDAYDLKRWWWKANDGIRETTWPGVYNRSRRPGRDDSFQLPDWDCYVESGRAITFTLSVEPVNHLEISGPAWGRLEHFHAASEDGAGGMPAIERALGSTKTSHRLATPLVGGALRFSNAEPETPIQEFGAYHVAPGRAPAGATTRDYRLDIGAIDRPGLRPFAEYIAGRHPTDEASLLVARPAIESLATASHLYRRPTLPFVHLLVPAPTNSQPVAPLSAADQALDGIELELPALAGTGPIAFNLRVKDPLWPARDALDFTFSVAPGEPHTLWLDLRDRILPGDRALYLSLASSSPGFDATVLVGARLGLVFKPACEGRAEHIADRFTQVRDAFAMWVEERPRDPRYGLYARLVGDLQDLLRVDPANPIGLAYAAALRLDYPRPPFTQPKPPAGVPLWAFRQTELLKRLQYFAEWYVDHRQVDYGDLGGGISDDTDLTNYWPGLALMGCAPEKLTQSISRLLDAAYANGMFDHGLCAIQTDELHSYEEGINCLGQNLILDYGSPRQLERAMETTRALFNLTGINPVGHRHLRSAYYSGSILAEDGVWGWARPYGHLVFQIPGLLADFNGNPEARRLIVETADGLLAHRKLGADGRYHRPAAIHFATDTEQEATRNWLPWPLFWNAWQWSGDRRYLDPIFDLGVTGVTELNADALDLLDLRTEWGPRILAGERGRPVNFRRIDSRSKANGGHREDHRPDRQFVWQLTGDKTQLESLYAEQLEYCAVNEFINTEGSLWIDRPAVPAGDIQRARLGGIALMRNAPFPGHVVSWRFATDAQPGAHAVGQQSLPASPDSAAADVAILIPRATATEFTVIAYNLSTAPIRAQMTGWNVAPGTWRISQGIDGDGDDRADTATAERTAPFERSRSITIELPPRQTTILTCKLVEPGVPYWQRPDLGLDPQDVAVAAESVRVTVHSLGAVPTSAATAILRGAAGLTIASAPIPSLPAPIDLQPKVATIVIPIPARTDLGGATVELSSGGEIPEISLRNNRVPVARSRVELE